MAPVFAPRFGLTECNSDQEREFIETLHARAELGGWYADAWPRDDRVMLSVCSCDRDAAHNCVLRTLRTDFDGDTVSFGPDETHHFATDLDPTRPGVFVFSGGTVAELAAAAADWLEREMRRPILRHEWDRTDQRGVAPRLWVLAETGEHIVARGLLSSEFGPPDRIVVVSE
jgi:hypothetical protein